MRRLSLLMFPLLLMVGCIESDPPSFDGVGAPCVVDNNCFAGLECLAGRCSPADFCAAGIYVGDSVPARPGEDGRFPAGSVVRQTSGASFGISAAEGQLRITQDGEPRRFAINFYNEPGKPVTDGLFVEARLQLGADSEECGAVLDLWPTRRQQIKLCIGGGKIGMLDGEGGSTSWVANVPDLTQMHTYRLNVMPTAPGLGGGPPNISLTIDGAFAAGALALADIPVPAEPSELAPLIEFGAAAPGVVVFDYVRWGCNPDGGTCRPDLQDDDDCETQRQARGGCDGSAVAVERCDELDNDCDGVVDEDFKATFPDGRPFGFDDFGEEVFKGQRCGLNGTCAEAVVVCGADELSLVCDVSAVSVPEVCDGLDNDCDGLIDEDFGPQSATPEMLYLDPVTNERVALGAPCGSGACAEGIVVCEGLTPACSTASVQRDDEICGNAIDDDCDGRVDEGFDVDRDGFQSCLRCAAEPCSAGAHDCNDSAMNGAQINPGAEEICNQIDDNCNNQIDEGLDLDGDGFWACGPMPDCRNDPAGDIEGEPTASEINPNADEACDSTDNDCDGRIDEGFSQLQPNGSVLYTSRAHCGQCGNDCAVASDNYNTTASCAERPGGGFGCSTQCRPGFLDVDGDVAVAEQFWNLEDVGDDNTGCECRIRADTICDSGNVNVSCAEICNGIDDDCDGSIDEEADMDLPACWDGGASQRQVGICRDGRRRCIDGRLSDQCFGSTLPEAGQERFCDNRDEDCDGRLDEGDALTDPSGQIRAGDLCDTGLEGVCAAGRQACAANEIRCVANDNGSVEVCDGLDNDCDGRFEEDTDADGDGVPRCRPCANGEVPNAQGFCEFDCNDSPANGGEGTAFSPNIDERCTGQDNNCNGLVDEAFVLVDDAGHPIALNGEPVFGAENLVYNQLDHCGACGQACARPNGLTNCDQGICTLVDCRPGFLDEDGNPDNGCEQSDCRVDNVGAQNMALLGTVCSKPMYDNASECGCVGTFQCLRGGAPSVECVVDPNNPDEGAIVGPAECPAGQKVNVEAEACNALDDDCDGVVDEAVCP